MQATGNRPPGTVAAKGAYMARDIQRCAAHVGIPFYMNPAFPVNTLAALRATVGFEDKAEQRRFATACFQESWSVPQPLNLAIRRTCSSCARSMGLTRPRSRRWPPIR